MNPDERRRHLTEVARGLAAQARAEVAWFEARAEQCEQVVRAIQSSEKPEDWEKAYQSMLGEWVLGLDGTHAEEASRESAP